MVLRAASEKKKLRTASSRRLQALVNQFLHGQIPPGRLVLPRPRASAATPGPAGIARPETAHTGVKTDASGKPEWPVVDPYGPYCTLESYGTQRRSEHSAATVFMEKVRNQEVPPPSDAIAYQFFQEGTYPYLDGPSFVPDPYVMSQEANEVFRPVLRRMVESYRDHQGTWAARAAEPKVVKGFPTYVESKRFEAELKYIFKEGVLLAGLSNDLGLKPHNYLKWDGDGTLQESLGISLVLYRDGEGRFRVFKNFVPNRPPLLASDEPPQGNNSQLGILEAGVVEVPSLEKSGLLWVIPHVPENGEAEVKRLLEEVMPKDLVEEIEPLHFEKHHCVASQMFKAKCNWKLLNDTFGENYHIGSLHPILQMIVVSNLQDHRTWGDGPNTRNGAPGGVWHSVNTAARFTTRVMARGEVDEKQWEEPAVNFHCVHLYHLAPNCCLLVRPDGFSTNIVYPGDSPGESFIKISQYIAKAPQTKKDLEKAVKVWKVAVDVFCFEDFWACERIQQNLTSNPHAEMCFGRNEPTLVDRHIYYERCVKGRY